YAKEADALNGPGDNNVPPYSSLENGFLFGRQDHMVSNPITALSIAHHTSLTSVSRYAARLCFQPLPRCSMGFHDDECTESTKLERCGQRSSVVENLRRIASPLPRPPWYG